MNKPEIVLHFARARPNLRRVDRRMLGSIVGGLALILAAVVRLIAGGQSLQRFAVDAGIAAVILAVIGLYVLLLFRNTSVYVRAGRIGFTSAIGVRHDVPVSEVVRLRRNTEPAMYTGGNPVNVLLIVTRNPKQTLRIRGADYLDDGGIDALGAAINVPIDGQWA